MEWCPWPSKWTGTLPPPKVSNPWWSTTTVATAFNGADLFVWHLKRYYCFHSFVISSCTSIDDNTSAESPRTHSWFLHRKLPRWLWQRRIVFLLRWQQQRRLTLMCRGNLLRPSKSSSSASSPCTIKRPRRPCVDAVVCKSVRFASLGRSTSWRMTWPSSLSSRQSFSSLVCLPSTSRCAAWNFCSRWASTVTSATGTYHVANIILMVILSHKQIAFFLQVRHRSLRKCCHSKGQEGSGSKGAPRSHRNSCLRTSAKRRHQQHRQAIFRHPN